MLISQKKSENIQSQGFGENVRGFFGLLLVVTKGFK